MARPTKYTPEVVGKLTATIRLGTTYKLACDYAGISTDSFERWRRDNAGFAARIKEAEGAAAVAWLQQIEDAATRGTWQAAAWKLERRYPQDYGRRAEQVQGPNTEPFTFTIGLGDDDVRERLNRKLDELAERRRLAAAEGA
jgi:hypothetical protein